MAQNNPVGDGAIDKPAAAAVEAPQAAHTAVENQGPGLAASAIKGATDALVNNGTLKDVSISGAANEATARTNPPADSSAAPKADAALAQFGNLTLDVATPSAKAALTDGPANSPSSSSDTPQGTTYQLNDGMKGQKPVAEIQTIQQELNALNFNAGTPDGEFGAGTQKAVKDFQTANGLPATGDADPATQAKLQGLAGDKVQQISDEAKKLEPLVQQFMTGHDANVQKTNIDAYQKELGNFFATNGQGPTGLLLNQVALDLKADPKLDATVSISSNGFGVENNKVLKNLEEATPTYLGSTVSAKDVSTMGVDGDTDYDDAWHTSFQLDTTAANGVPTTKDNSHVADPIPDNGGYSGGGDDNGGGNTSGNGNGLSVGETVQIQNPDGSLGFGYVVSD